MEEFDEMKAVESMRAALGSDKYDDDQLLNVLDMIWDFYEQNGLLDPDIDDDYDEEAVFEEIVEYVKRMVAKDMASTVVADDIPALVAGEIAYEDSLI